MKKCLCLLISFFALSSFASDIHSEKYPWCKTVEIPAERPAFFLIPLDEEISRHTEPGQPDLRIVSPSGEQVPYVVSPLPLKWQTVRSLESIDGKIVGFSLDEKENIATIEYELADTARPVSVLHLHTADQDFDKSIILEFDNGFRTEKMPFFNHAKNVRFQNTEFGFPPQKAKRIKIHVYNFAEKRAASTVLEHRGKHETFRESRLFTRELHLEKIRFFVTHETILPDPVRRILPLTELSREKKGETTEIRLDAGRRKIEALIFLTSTPGYLREVRVQAVRRNGETVATGTFTGKIDPRDHELPVGNFRADEYIVTIQNGDDPELAELTISANIEEEALLLEGAAAPSGTLKILYGSDDTESPQYGLRKYVSNLYGKDWKVVTASPETVNPEFREAADPGRFFKQAIGWILAAAVLFLAVLAWKNFSRIPPEKE